MIFNRSNLRLGRLTLSSLPAPPGEAPVGIRRLGLTGKRDAVCFVPPAYDPQTPWPFALLLHGAGGSAGNGLLLLQQWAEKENLILLAPSSRQRTWDIIDEGMFDLDVLFINQAMERVLQTYAIDRSRLAIGGFSDGASYALSLGLINGDLFTHILAFSPGFYHAPTLVGKPKIFISHGLNDPVLPIAPCSHRLVPRLERAGYEVTYREFGSGHLLPENISAEAVNWFV